MLRSFAPHSSFDVFRRLRAGFSVLDLRANQVKEFFVNLIPTCFIRNRRAGYLSRAAKRPIRLAVLVLMGLALGQGPMTMVRAQQPQSRSATIHGRVVDARSGEPVAKVKIIVSGTSQSTTTDDSGNFTIANLPQGELDLYITTVGYGLVKKTIILKEGDTAGVLIALNQEAATLTEHVTVTAEPYAVTETNAPAEQTLNKTELQDLSKVIIGDPLRAVHSLPSVTANDDLRSEFSVRGADYHRVGIFLDGILTNSLVHSAAGNADEKVTLSVINSDTIGAVSLLSGAFPAKYGDATAAVLNFVTRDGNRLKPAFRFSTGLQLGTSGVVDGPLANKRGSWLIAARSSLLDYLSRVVDDAASEDNIDTGLVGFNDVAGKVVLDLSPRNQVGFSGLYSGLKFDDIRNPFANPNSVHDSRSRNLMLSGFWNYVPNPSLIAQTRVFGTRTIFKNSNHDDLVINDEERTQIGIRNDINFLGFSSQRVEAGLYLRSVSAKNIGRLLPFSSTGAILNLVNYDRSTSEQGYYLQDTYTNERLGLSLTGGARIEHSGLTGETLVSPRAAMALKLKSRWTARAGFGRYYQFPDFNLLFGQLGNRNLHAERATHYNASVEWTFGDRYRLLTEVYDREDRDLIFSLSEPRLQSTTVTFNQTPFDNSLNGHARGIELTFQRRSANRLSGWISYAYSRTRLQHDSSNLRFVSDFDQRHTMNGYGSYRFTETFNVSGQWRYGSGFPIPGFFRAQGDELFLAPDRNLVRQSAYRRLDLRANKAFLFKKWKLTLSGELLNVLNHKNLRLPVIDGFDPTTGRVFHHFGDPLPVLPAIGVAIEF